MNTPQDYYAVIFTSVRTEKDEGYETMADWMVRLAEQQPGYLGIESARNEMGITVSYWESEEAIRNWKNQLDHQIAQKLGREKWYESYTVRVCKVIRTYSFDQKS